MYSRPSTLLACVFTLVLTLGLSAQEREEQFVAEIGRLTPDVEAVVTGGRWLRGSDVGTFRLIIRVIGLSLNGASVPAVGSAAKRPI